MKAKAKRKAPEIILREGKPRAVILDINDYQEMLERLRGGMSRCPLCTKKNRG